MTESTNIDNKDASESKWYRSWFDSPYYHILYKDRNYREAQIFMDNLTHYLNLPERARVLDLACGKGRHSIYLSQLGFDVLGVDLSENSIAEARKNTNDHLHFSVHDMRRPLDQKFDAIFNLFTSFGYFAADEDNLNVLRSIKENLSEYGFAVIDFMNVAHVVANLVPEETKTVDGISFNIRRSYDGAHIIKNISFSDNGQDFHFVEKVKAFTLDDFKSMMDGAGIYLLDTFGDYKLRKFHKTDSERLIMIFK